MPIEFQVSLEDKPGSLAWLGSVLGEADVNFEAIEGRSGRGVSVVHFVASDTEAAAAVLEQSGIPYSKRDVVVVNVLDQPGTLGDVAFVMSEAGINIDCVFSPKCFLRARDGYAGEPQLAADQLVTRLREVTKAENVPLDVLIDIAQEDDIRVVFHAFLLKVQEHLAMSVPVNTQIEHLDTRQHLGQVVTEGFVVGNLMPEREGVTDHHDTDDAVGFLVGVFPGAAKPSGVRAEHLALVNLGIVHVGLRRPAANRVMDVKLIGKLGLPAMALDPAMSPNGVVVQRDALKEPIPR